MSVPARRFRLLESSDALAPPTVDGLGGQLQLLAAHGDRDWLEDLAVFVNQRVLNVLAMEAARQPHK